MNWSTFATLSVLSAAIHWIVARSKIMKWFWGARWLPHFFRDLLACPACSGFWVGLTLGALGILPIAPLPFRWLEVLTAGVLAVWGTPVAQAIVLWGLDRSRLDG